MPCTLPPSLSAVELSVEEIHVIVLFYLSCLLCLPMSPVSKLLTGCIHLVLHFAASREHVDIYGHESERPINWI